MVTGKELLAIPKQPGSVVRLAFSPDGARLGAGIVNPTSGGGRATYRGTVTVWDAATGKELLVLPTSPPEVTDPRTPDRPVVDFVFSPDNPRLALFMTSSKEHGNVTVWDLTTGKIADTVRVGEVVTHAKFSPDGKWLATVGSDPTVRIWDVDPKRTDDGKLPLLVLRGHTDSITRLAFHPDGSRLFTSGSEGTVKVWDISAGGQPLIIKGTSGYLGSFLLAQRLDASSPRTTIRQGQLAVVPP